MIIKTLILHTSMKLALTKIYTFVIQIACSDFKLGTKLLFEMKVIKYNGACTKRELSVLVYRAMV